MKHQAITLLLLLAIALLPHPLEAQKEEGMWQLVFVGRTFLQLSPGLREAPLLAVSLPGERAGIVTLISNGSMRIVIADANSTILSSAVIELEGALPFCASSYGRSLEVLVKKGLSLRGYILTEEGNIVEGLKASFPGPFFPSGCTKEGPLYLVYGGVVAEGTVDPAIVAFRPNGEVAWEARVPLPGDESVYDLIAANDTIYAVVVNASNGVLSLYRLQDESLSLLRSLGAYDYLSGAALDGGGVALLLSNSSSTLIVEYSPSKQTTTIRLPVIYVAKSLAYSRGVLLVSGWTLNTTTRLADGFILAIDPEEGRILAKSIVYGADDVMFTAVVPLDGEAILAAGTHGNRTMLAGFLLSHIEPQTTAPPPQAQTPPVAENGGIPSFVPVAVTLAALVALAVYIRSRPSPRLKKGAP